LFEETLEPLAPSAKVVATFENGSAAAVENVFGRGKTLMLGSYVSAAYQSEPSAEGRRFFANLLEWAGVESPVEVRGSDVEVQMLESGRERLLFVFNHSKQAVEPALTLRESSYSATDLKTGQPVEELSARIPPEDVWVLRLSPR
jgi:hypothetical protein